jgi:hypothetical protein
MPRNRPLMTLRLLTLSVSLAVFLCVLPGFRKANLTAHASSAQPGNTPWNMQDAQASPCKGIPAQPDTLKQTLSRVPKYHKTYVLVVGPNAQAKITSATSPGLADTAIEINDEPSANAVAQDLHLTNVHRVPMTDQSPLQPLVDLGAGKTDAVIMWAPLAGIGLIDLGLDDKSTVFTVDRPQDPPPAFAGPQSIQTDACASAIADDLDSFGVLPGELMVPIVLRSLLNTATPIFTMANAQQGGVVFNQICARCHGPNAVWDKTLAPVNLLVSIQRFQFIGFKYIVMNGRAQKGMPPLRGTVSEEQIALIYQYLQARSKKLMTASLK